MNDMQLTLFSIPSDIRTLAIVVALFAVFFGLVSLVVWNSINMIIDRYPEMPSGALESDKKKVIAARRKLLGNMILFDGFVLTAVLMLTIYLVNAII